MQVILLRRSIVLKNCNKTSLNIKDQRLVLVTRQATCGSKTDRNAHAHFDEEHRVSLLSTQWNNRQKESPILVGYNQSSIFVASEKIAFEIYTQNYIQLQDGESIHSVKHRLIFDEHQEYEQVHLKPKAPYQTFFDMEIHKQPITLLRCLGNGGRLAGNTDSSKLGGLELKEQELDVEVAIMQHFALNKYSNLNYSKCRLWCLSELWKRSCCCCFKKFHISDYRFSIIRQRSDYAIARERALKIKELTYKHAEAFCTGELKHGLLALIDSSKEKSAPIILLILKNSHIQDMKLSLSEVHSRNALENQKQVK